MRQLQLDDRTDFSLSKLFGVAMGPARLFLQSSKAETQEALLPLIASLSTDPVFLAQRPEVLRP
jgi:hypothetical protein